MGVVTIEPPAGYVSYSEYFSSILNTNIRQNRKSGHQIREPPRTMQSHLLTFASLSTAAAPTPATTAGAFLVVLSIQRTWLDDTVDGGYNSHHPKGSRQGRRTRSIDKETHLLQSRDQSTNPSTNPIALLYLKRWLRVQHHWTPSWLPSSMARSFRWRRR